MAVGIVQLVKRDVIQSNPQFSFYVSKGETDTQISEQGTCDYPGCYQCENCDTNCDCICYSIPDD